MRLNLEKILKEINESHNYSWDEITLYVKVNKGFSSYKGEIKTHGEIKSLDVEELPMEFGDKFIDHYEDKTSNKGNRWNEMEIRLTPKEVMYVKYIWNQERYDRIEEYNKRFNS